MVSMELQVGVKVLLRNSEGKYLLIKRSAQEQRGVGKWDIPSGREEADTSLMENLAREVMEETGLTMASEPELIDVQDMQWPERHVVRIVYSARGDGTPRLSNEHTELGWFTADDIRTMNEDIFDKFLLALFRSSTM